MALSLGIRFSGISDPKAIAMANLLELVARFFEQGKCFWTTLNRSRFDSTGPVGHLVPSDYL
jgi:hypothetical protein